MRRTVGTCAVVILVLMATPAVMLATPPPAWANETVVSCANGVDHVFAPAAILGINTPYACPGNPALEQGMSIEAVGNTVAAGQRADWQANAPSGLVIVGASVAPGGMTSDGINDGGAFGGGFYWAGGGSEVYDGEMNAGFAPLWSSYFGWQVVCGLKSCSHNLNALAVSDISLYVQETVGPTLASPDGLWQAPGWVRGDWTLHFYGDSPSGLCGLGATINDQSAASIGSPQDTSVWHQCDAPSISQTIHTWQYGGGAMPLTLSAWDAAGEPVDYTRTIYIDNSQPTVSLSGPTDVPSTAGTQYVTATAAAGPSGMYGISCSVDGASAQWYPGATAQVPVSGVGEHSIQCSAANNAVDPAGNHGWSDPATWSLKIGDPTESGITFGHIVNALHCQPVKERVKVPARWVTVRRHHKSSRIRRRAHTKLVSVTRCHARTKLERVAVRVRVHRDGKQVWITRYKRERIVLIPHLENSTQLRVGHGQPAAVSGWLGNYAGVALGGQTVSVLTAPDNGLGQFTTAATVTTAADGRWSATLSPGPSRLIEAAYSGGPTTEPSVSGQVHLVVPAKIGLLSISPREVAWGGTVRLVGQLYDGYLPPTGALVRLRIGIGANRTTYGVKEHVTGNGTFSTSYTFGAGLSNVYRRYWFQVASLPTGDYPYAPANSRRMSVIVGGHPAPPPPKHHRRRRTR